MILSYNGKPIEQRANGYVNLTQMAKANGVRFADWIENEASKKYLESLQQSIFAENGTNAELIQVNGFGSQKATWGHPLVAIAFAQWISPEFHVWCNRHIKTLIETGSTSVANEINQTITEQISVAIDMVFKGLTIEPALVAGIKLNAIEKANPAIAPYLEESRQILIASTARGEDELLSATQIGKLIGKSAQWVNKKLVEIGFQVKNDKKTSKKDATYIPTGKGTEFASLTLATINNHEDTVQQLRWYKSVIEQLA